MPSSFVMFRQAFVVTDTAAMAGDPGQGALYDPTSWRHLETDDIVCSFHDGDRDLDGRRGPVEEFACVASIGPLRSRIPTITGRLIGVDAMAISGCRVLRP